MMNITFRPFISRAECRVENSSTLRDCDGVQGFGVHVRVFARECRFSCRGKCVSNSCALHHSPAVVDFSGCAMLQSGPTVRSPLTWGSNPNDRADTSGTLTGCYFGRCSTRSAQIRPINVRTNAFHGDRPAALPLQQDGCGFRDPLLGRNGLPQISDRGFAPPREVFLGSSI